MKSMKYLALVLVLMAVVFSPNTVFAQWNKCLHFTWHEHDRVVIPNSSLWPGEVPSGTVEMWFKPDSVFKSDTHDPDYTYIFSKNISGDNAGDMGMHWIRGQGDLKCFVQSGDPANLPTQTCNAGIEVWEPRWYHVAFVWDKGDTLRLFIDGVQAEDTEANCLPVTAGEALIAIGTGAQDNWDNRYETWRGCIDEVRISAVARYKEDFAPPVEPYDMDAYTIALWHFDEGEGTVTNDEGPFNFDGVLGNPDSAGYAIPEWVDVQRDPRVIINEFLADAADDVNGDGSASATEDQFVELLNVSSKPIDISGWKLGDESAVDFTFPDGYVIQPSQFVVVFGGGSVSSCVGYDADQLKTKVFAADGTIGGGLASDGDIVVLQSANGIENAHVAYGSKKGTVPAGAVADLDWEFAQSTNANAANDNSLTRNPDAEFELEDCFAEHKNVAGVNYSPGKTIDGYEMLQFNLVINVLPAGAGSVEMDSISAAKEFFGYGDLVSLTANPSAGYIFDKWTEDEESTSNPVYFAMNRSKTITANFIKAFQVEPTIIINEVNADPSSDPILGDANRDGIRHAGQDEYIELLNVSTEPVDMSGWKLGDDEQLSFTFPEGYILPSGEFVTVFGGGDISYGPAVGYDEDPLKTRVFLSDSSASDKVGNGLPNAGECIVLINKDTTYAMQCNYGSHFGRGVPTKGYTGEIYFNMRMEADVNAGKNTSIVRVNEADPNCIEFAQHKTLVDAENSPSQSINFESQITIKPSAIEEGQELPEEFRLWGNYPNPFNPTTNIRFSIPKHSVVSLTVYDMVGKKVTELTNKEYAAGIYDVQWNGKDNRGNTVPTGVYFYTINVNGKQRSNKMVLVK